MSQTDYERYSGSDGKYIAPRAKAIREEHSRPIGWMEEPLHVSCGRCKWTFNGAASVALERQKKHRKVHT